eukprot:UN11493
MWSQVTFHPLNSVYTYLNQIHNLINLHKILPSRNFQFEISKVFLKDVSISPSFRCPK